MLVFVVLGLEDFFVAIESRGRFVGVLDFGIFRGSLEVFLPCVTVRGGAHVDDVVVEIFSGDAPGLSGRKLGLCGIWYKNQVAQVCGWMNVCGTRPRSGFVPLGNGNQNTTPIAGKTRNLVWEVAPNEYRSGMMETYYLLNLITVLSGCGEGPAAGG